MPAYARQSPKVTDVLPVLYLRGLSTGGFAPALKDLLGEDASGLSASSISRLTEQWQADHAAFRQRSLRFHRYAYLFIDGIHMSIRLGEDDRLCLLVVIGVREDGEKELLAIEDGYHESTDAWAAVLRDLKDRGLNEPKLVTGDGALGAWAALKRRLRGGRRAALLGPQIGERLGRDAQAPATAGQELAARDGRSPDRGRRPRRTRALPLAVRRQVPQGHRETRQGWDALTAFYAFPAEHWRHLRTTNPIESSFATVRLRTKVIKGAGSKKAAFAMAYKLLDAAQQRWRRFNGHELIADVLAGVTFKDGERVIDEDNNSIDERVAV